MNGRPENPAKTFLKRYREALYRQQSLIRHLAALRDRQTDCTIKLRPQQVQSGWAGDRIAEEIIRAIDLEDQIQEAEKEASRVLAEVMEAIRAVPDEMQRTVLTLRYIEGLGWIRIQEQIGYERTQTLIIHGKALRAVNQWMGRKSADENGLQKML